MPTKIAILFNRISNKFYPLPEVKPIPAVGHEDVTPIDKSSVSNHQICHFCREFFLISCILGTHEEEKGVAALRKARYFSTFVHETFSYKHIFFNHGNRAHFRQQDVGHTPPIKSSRNGLATGEVLL